MKVKVNQEACIGCGACEAIASDLFKINDEGLSEAISPEVVGDEKVELAKEAIESCPTAAIEEVNEEELKQAA